MMRPEHNALYLSGWLKKNKTKTERKTIPLLGALTKIHLHYLEVFSLYLEWKHKIYSFFS